MKNKKKFGIILGFGILLSLVLTALVLGIIEPRPRGLFKHVENFFMVKIFITTLNIFLIGSLIWNYTSIYKEMKNKFTLSLMIFSLSLLFYAVSSSPIFHILFGFRGSGLGPFQFIPDLFSLIAVTILLYQSYE